jgi:hypothetical protein
MMGMALIAASDVRNLLLVCMAGLPYQSGCTPRMDRLHSYADRDKTKTAKNFLPIKPRRYG